MSEKEKKAASRSSKKTDKAVKVEQSEAASVELPAKPRLRLQFEQDIVPAMVKEFGFRSVMQVPRLEKITINMGLGEAVGNPNVVKIALEELSLLSGQRAVITRAKKAIANFKLRAGLGIGCMVTLRRARMWEFLDRLISIAIPRIRDFKGISNKAFDGLRSYSLGLREQIIFPEIVYDRVDKIRGMNITITTTANSVAECRSLLKHLGMPFRN
jgi:large subunit ribosomal protein L5